MLIRTRDFGDVEISEDEIISFPDGVFGFENAKRFAVLSDGDADLPFIWLQAVDSTDPCFITLKPSSLSISYDPMLPPAVFQELGASSSNELSCLLIATIPNNIWDMTINLKAPVIINPAKKIGRQIILDSSEYPFRYKLFSAAARRA